MPVASAAAQEQEARHLAAKAEQSAAEQRLLELQARVQADASKRKTEASKKRKDQERILGTGKNGKRERISFKMSL
jgi:hypothetical protein